MTKLILGISAFFQDAAAALVRGDELLSAAKEERFSRKTNDTRFPARAIAYCLEEASVAASEIDAVIFYQNPVVQFHQLVEKAVAAGEDGRAEFLIAADRMLMEQLWIEDQVGHALGTLGRQEMVLFSEHHMAHAAAAFYPSPFERAAILTMAGGTQWATTSLGHGEGNAVRLLFQLDYPHSLELLYSTLARHCGFVAGSDEHTLTGLSRYGEPRYYKLMRQHLIDVRPDGSYELNPAFFGDQHGTALTSLRFARLFGGAPRHSLSPISRREMDLAATLQKITEEIVVNAAKHLRAVTHEKDLVLSGGHLLNCIVHGQLIAQNIFDHVWIQRAAGDAGGAIGAAMLASHAYFGAPRRVCSRDAVVRTAASPGAVPLARARAHQAPPSRANGH